MAELAVRLAKPSQKQDRLRIGTNSEGDKERYANEVRGTLGTAPEGLGTEEWSERINEALKKAAEGTILTSETRPKKPWISESTWALINERAGLAEQG
eukprot:9360473-Alexandrium_andersonii.AAC.1